MSQFIYLLNAMENAGADESPARCNYGGKRRAVIEYVEALERRLAQLEWHDDRPDAKEEKGSWSNWRNVTDRTDGK